MVLSTRADYDVVCPDGHGGEWNCNRRSHRSRMGGGRRLRRRERRWAPGWAGGCVSWAVRPALGPEPAELGVEHLEHDCMAGLAGTESREAA